MAIAAKRLASAAFGGMFAAGNPGICFQGDLMTTISVLRTTAVLAILLLGLQAGSAQEDTSTPSTSRVFGSHVGHRQPRPTDIPQTDKSAAEQLEEKRSAELNRRLRICRGC